LEEGNLSIRNEVRTKSHFFWSTDDDKVLATLCTRLNDENVAKVTDLPAVP
jgi:hypothetical protein